MRDIPKKQKEKIQRKIFDLGILIDRPHSVWQVGKRSHFLYREMTEMAQEHQIRLFFFFAGAVDWEKKRVQGYIWQKNRWQKALFPLPKVIYSRIVERSQESRPENQAFLQRVKETEEIELFNTRFLDKYEVFQALGSYPEIQPYLPQTAAGSPENLEALLKQHHSVYLKPVDGCRGRGILRVDQIKPEVWHIQKAGDGQLLLMEGKEKLLGALSAIPVDWTQYIMQQAIPLARYRGRCFDIRALAQKDGQGKWTYVGAAARIAKEGGIVTHVSNGGSRAPLAKVLKTEPVLSERSRQIQKELQWLCPLLATLLEKQLPLHWGLIAFDIALDTGGNLYLLEANARPGSYSETAIRRRSLCLLMEYSRYLAERSPEI